MTRFMRRRIMWRVLWTLIGILSILFISYLALSSRIQHRKADPDPRHISKPFNLQEDENYIPSWRNKWQVKLNYKYPQVVNKTRKYPLLTNKHSSHSTAPPPVDQLWTYVSRNTLAYRIAHFETRHEVYGGPALVALVLFDTLIITESFPELSAIAVYSDEKEIITEQGKFIKLRRPKPLEYVHSYIVVFKLKKSGKELEIPYAAFICMTEDCTKHTAYLTVYWEDPPAKKLDFSVCLHQAIFEESDDEKVAAWFEMNRALGAQLITVYYQEFHPKVVSIVQKYVDEGLVQAYDWYNNFTVEADNNFGQAILIIDCFYRNLFKSEHIAFNDLDEILMPHRSPTWYGMWEDFYRYKPSGSHFRFCHAAFYVPKKTIPLTDWLKTKSTSTASLSCSNLTKVPVMFERSIRTAHARCSSSYIRYKSFVIPMRIKKMAIHSAVPLPGYMVLDVPENLGILHHYRRSFEKKKLRGEGWSKTDQIAMNYIKPVMNGLVKKFCSGKG